jgi:hypothetical protein
VGQWKNDATGACPGACFGAGVCADCRPGDKQCGPGKQPQKCDAMGHWANDGAACANVCMGGSCAPACMAGAKTCAGKQPQVCDGSGNYQNDGMPCPNLCVGAGVCGVCVPGGPAQCAADGRTPQTCNMMGQWVDGQACMSVCNQGACGGECVPLTRQCNANVPQTCDASGHWVSGAACPFGCGGAGVCNASDGG